MQHGSGKKNMTTHIPDPHFTTSTPSPANSAGGSRNYGCTVPEKPKENSKNGLKVFTISGIVFTGTKQPGMETTIRIMMVVYRWIMVFKPRMDWNFIDVGVMLLTGRFGPSSWRRKGRITDTTVTAEEDLAPGRQDITVDCN